MQEDQIRQILEDFIRELNEILNDLPIKTIEVQSSSETKTGLSKQTLLELVYHEGIVLEAYKDSKGIWTWGVGVTNNSGHRVYPRYKDNPQTLEKVMEIFDWLVREKYLPDVIEAFKGHELNEEQLAAALSFHYNTGAIKRASWVRSFKQGNLSKSKREFMNWKSPPEIIPRRKAERDLFFEGVWTNDGKGTVYEVRKPSYSPKWSSAKRVRIYD